MRDLARRVLTRRQPGAVCSGTELDRASILPKKESIITKMDVMIIHDGHDGHIALTNGKSSRLSIAFLIF